ncbi:MAG: 3-isopropylmalate dehydratase small subunit [Rhodoferax sp.]|nr:3-isopropylmalate dehydratase small subunit [Rhodoferax sp.]
MSDDKTTGVAGRAAAIRIENLDTDQIMPKQFLRGIDKAGLADGLLYNLRFDAAGQVRPDCVLNRPEASGTRILIGGANFGCGSSREHAVWGLQQYGIDAVIAPSFGEIFYSNAMNNRLLLVMLPAAQIDTLMAAAERGGDAAQVAINVAAQRVRGDGVDADFSLSERHRRMFLEGLDVIGLSLAYRAETEAFAARHWAAQPWVKDVARRTCERLLAA